MSTPPRWDPDAPTPRPRPRERSRTSRATSGWGELFGEQRLAAAASAGLIVTMFLPWYTQTPVGISGDSRTLMAFQSWGFVEASILLVAVAVLGLVWARANRRAFHLPFGDGIVLMGAGAWVMFLVFYRQVDHPDGGPNVAVGVSWGIFLAFICGALITYAGWRLKATHRPEPVVDGDDPRTREVERTVAYAGSTATGPAESPTRRTPPGGPTTPAARGRGRSRPSEGPLEGQLSFEDSEESRP